ncbi:hypothetical protein F5884DRAFT_746624 [Xylogone sp. PMI_703]|nr:hypothetical protein F5884DRAFT_746624 [Xylogone sp. PMI_703]
MALSKSLKVVVQLVVWMRCFFWPEILASADVHVGKLVPGNVAVSQCRTRMRYDDVVLSELRPDMSFVPSDRRLRAAEGGGLALVWGRAYHALVGGLVPETETACLGPSTTNVTSIVRRHLSLLREISSCVWCPGLAQGFGKSCEMNCRRSALGFCSNALVEEKEINTYCSVHERSIEDQSKHKKEQVES